MPRHSGARRFAPVPGATLEDYAVNFVDRGFLLQERSADLAHLRGWLAERGTPLPEQLPAEFSKLRALGCRTLTFENRAVSLICFERDGREYHVFVTERPQSASPSQTIPEPPRVRSGHVYTSWSDQRNDYVLVSDASLEEVRQLL